MRSFKTLSKSTPAGISSVKKHNPVARAGRSLPHWKPATVRLAPGVPRRLPPEFPKTHHSKETANPFRLRKEHNAARSTYSPIIQIFRLARHDICRRHPYSRPGWV
jgi:hypothetical protein